MGRLCYQVACSLDGYIAGPSGEFDWIPDEPTFDFDALYARFDTLLMGRRTYEAVQAMDGAFRDKRVVVLSRTLRPEAHPGVEVVPEGVEARVRALKAEAGKDMWLYGGGEVFRSLLELGLVDAVELAVLPILLGGGVPFLPSPAPRTSLTLRASTPYPRGMVLLEYDVGGSQG